MSKKIELVHAEVISQYNSDVVLREFNTDKGATIFSWSTKTKVNDKVDKSPVIFDSCNSFADNEEKKEFIRSNVVLGAILDITGYQDRKKASKAGLDGKFKYYDQINVKNIISISGSDEATVELPSNDSLPF